MMCGMLGVEDADKVMEEIKVLEGAQEKRENNNSSKNHYSPQPYSPKIPSKLVLDISKPVYEKNENISLIAQWTGADVDCKILEEKVKETLDNRHFEIVDNSISCAGNDNKSLIQLRVQFKSPRIGKLNIPAITLENNISSNSVDFSAVSYTHLYQNNFAFVKPDVILFFHQQKVVMISNFIITIEV